MYTRKRDGEARHFYHPNSAAGGHCPAAGTGESDIHARCVALAAEALGDRFDSQPTQCGIEKRIELEDSYLNHDYRRADVCLEFESKNPYFGHGIVIEVQHKNHEKNIEAATYDYLKAGYSIAWLSTSDFGTDSLDYDIVEEAFQSNGGGSYSPREKNPLYLVRCEEYRYGGKHSWREVPSSVLDGTDGYELCIGRGCDLRRRYDEETDSYEYGISSGLPSYFRPKLLRKAIIRESTFEDFDSWLTQTYHISATEKAMAAHPEVEYCRGPKGFHEWKSPETVVSNSFGSSRRQLRECRYCPVHLLTDSERHRHDRMYIFFGGPPDPDVNLGAIEKNPERCKHRSHGPEMWVEYCPKCGDTDPQ
ncbi:hypothetical protein [Natronorubrum sp. DTA7]|uniref:hypothetical protein n=1 Tax=Natronorubrum sp. DTA7 TaxID=3447016 RepID=UPI003F87811C